MANRNQNFDFPLASDSYSNSNPNPDPNSAIGSLTDRFQDLRQALNPDPGESSNDQQRPHRRPFPTPSHGYSTRFRPGRRTAQPGPHSELPVLRGSRSPSSSPAAYTPPVPRSGRGRHMRNSWRRFRREMQDDTANLESLVRDRQIHLRQLHSQLNDTESTLRANDESAPRLHRSKRRKIADDTSERNVPAFRYGYYGQTVPGRLNMEIVSCDGGEYPTRDPIAIHRENYRAENVLRDDQSVYCTRSSRCNLLLRHRDETVFHLDSLTIRAPETGYTAPSLQQGLVFVGMTPESLVKGSAAYHIQYEDSSAQTRSSSPSSASDSIPLADALHDRAMLETLRNRPRDHDANPYRYPPPGSTAASRRAAFESRLHPITGVYPDAAAEVHGRELEPDLQNATYLDNCDWPALESVATSGLTRAPTPPPFTVIAESDDGSDDGSIRTGYLPPMISRDDGSEEYRDMILELHHGIPRPARRTSPGRIEPQSNSTEGDGERGEDILQPSASFFMGEQRSRITIKFEQPVSGRFLLLKLFSPQLHHGENIDIQYIQVNGYAGPRFFPKIEMR